MGVSQTMKQTLIRYGIWALLAGVLLVTVTGEAAAYVHLPPHTTCHEIQLFYEYVPTLGGPTEVCGELVGGTSV